MENITILKLYKVSPLGVFGMFITGMTMGAFFGMGAVYATEIGLSVRDVSFFMGALILGGFLFQYPLGWLSDYWGPSRVILVCCISGALVSFVALGADLSGAALFAMAAVVGGLTMPLYSLCSVHTNNYLNPIQMVAASGTLVLLSATGAAIGSPFTALIMELFGAQAFYGSLAAMLSSVAVFALWRSTKRWEVEPEEQGDFVVMAASPLTVSLNPDVELAEIEAAAVAEQDEILSSFDALVSELEGADAKGSAG